MPVNKTTCQDGVADMKDYICAINSVVLHKELRKLRLVDGDGSPDLGLPSIQTSTFTDSGHTFYFALIRCMEEEQKARIESLADIPALTILGWVEDEWFIWKDDESRILYESHMKVGEFREYLPVLDDKGNYVVNKDMELVKEKTKFPYRFGAFC